MIVNAGSSACKLSFVAGQARVGQLISSGFSTGDFVRFAIYARGDGTYDGKLVPSDVYIWKAEAMFKDGTVWDGNVVGNTDGMDNRTSGYVVVVR